MPRHATSTEVSTLQSSINFLTDNALTQKTKRKPDNITWITTFPAGHTWTGATDLVVTSTEAQFIGTQGVKYGPADPGTTRGLNSPNPMSPAIDLTDKMLVIAVKSLDDNGAG